MSSLSQTQQPALRHLSNNLCMLLHASNLIIQFYIHPTKAWWSMCWAQIHCQLPEYHTILKLLWGFAWPCDSHYHKTFLILRGTFLIHINIRVTETFICPCTSLHSWFHHRLSFSPSITTVQQINNLSTHHISLSQTIL